MKADDIVAGQEYLLVCGHRTVGATVLKVGRTRCLVLTTDGVQRTAVNNRIQPKSGVYANYNSGKGVYLDRI